MFTAKELPSGNWRVQYILKDSNGKVIKDENGKRTAISFTAPTKYEAVRMACEFAGQRQNPKEYEEQQREKEISMTVNEALGKYIDDSRGVLRDSTIRGYEIIRRTRLQVIKDIPLKSLILGDIQRAVNADRARLSKKSIRESIALLKRVLTLNGITLNFKAITLPKDYRQKKPLPNAAEVLKPFIGTKYEIPILLAMWCSLRVSELRGLKYSDITNVKDRHFMNIHHTKIYFDGMNHIDDMTKTEKSTRTILLPDYLYKLIKSQQHNSDDEYIVKLGYNALYKAFKKKMKSVGLDFMTLHKLRHEFATTLNDLGINSDYIQQLGGWSSPNIMKSVYTHTTNERELFYQSQIDNHFEGIINTLKEAT